MLKKYEKLMKYRRLTNDYPKKPVDNTGYVGARRLKAICAKNVISARKIARLKRSRSMKQDTPIFTLTSAFTAVYVQKSALRTRCI